MEKIIGVHAVLETLIANEKNIEKVYLAHGNRRGKLKEIEDRALMLEIPLDFITPKQIIKLCGSQRHQGVMAIVRPHKYLELQNLLQKSIANKKPPLFLVIDQIQDPRNLGAILRTAEGAGVDGVILTKRRTAPFSAIVAKTSSGAINHLNICRVSNLVNALEKLKELGIWIVGTVPNTDKNIYELKGNDAMAIVIGSEGKGLRRLVMETCDTLVQIPMSGKIASLNASVAAAIILYEIKRQRILI